MDPNTSVAPVSNGTTILVDNDKEKLQKSKKELLAIGFHSFQKARDWVVTVMDQRIREIADNSEPLKLSDITPCPQWLEGSAWLKMEQEMNLSEGEMFLLAFVYLSQFRPDSVSQLWTEDSLAYRVGGVQKEGGGSMSPTFRTVVYLLAGDKGLNHAVYYSLLVDSRLFREQVVVAVEERNEILDNQKLKLNDEFYRWMMTGTKVNVGVSTEFPAVLLDTHLTFEDLVLKESVTDQLKFLMDFVRHQDAMYSDESFSSKVKKGYVAMLYGPPGTGKTMTVSVMGKELGIDVYCIDLSRVVSKYIGETEKNLEKIFQRLEHKRCILFFDEADALFGKRTEVKDARDRYANQEVAYLLQKIERFPGLVILTSNYNQNLDSAFRRRILSSIFMPPPGVEERLTLWKKALPTNYQFEPENLPEKLAKDYMLTGANIANIIKLGCIKAHHDVNNPNVVTSAILTPIIKLEQHKEKNS
ncbi:hypothetical protein BFP72_06275 [Reichenbachiella sp. 5M10]|uniref:ATP-binding protein n=1 Tax=Reichenbachiella sp. 5M10 TaxID=1889772 RepID=UPI000C14F9B3|nr:ATP-binding protein [Reichenbachiella sp. 5M10]PIB35027.1 hypothetical protein BFP72_06275 [Reichenbachiella sp. 5M10]